MNDTFFKMAAMIGMKIELQKKFVDKSDKDDISVKSYIFKMENLNLEHENCRKAAKLRIIIVILVMCYRKCNRVDVESQPGHTGDTTAVKLSMRFSVS